VAHAVAQGTRPDPAPEAPTAADEDPGADRRRAQRLLLIFGRLGAAVSEALHARVDPAFTTNVEVMVLTSIDLLGPQRPADIIELTGLSSGGVTKVLDRLEANGLMVREYGRVAGDRRGTRLVLTPEGERVAGLLAAGLEDRMDAIRRAVDELRSVAGP
jgi:DNA-binding MarR family transcriptional regulator